MLSSVIFKKTQIISNTDKSFSLFNLRMSVTGACGVSNFVTSSG
jgi:hypothetical protein